jgi:type I restriction enzyme M protein
VDQGYRDHSDGELGRVGYEINPNRCFYQYLPPRPLQDIQADIEALQAEILDMLRESAQ